MRFRLLRRRLTISAPSMAIRSALPWPFRWAAMAVVLGFCAAIGLWAFEFGKDIAGVDGGAKEELLKLRTDNAVLKQERDKAQSVANTAQSVQTAEKAAQDQLRTQSKQLESENRALRDDLGFFERLMPAGNTDGVSIRGLQVDVLGNSLKWQVLAMQPGKNAPEFSGKLEIAFTGQLAGKPWSTTLSGGALPIVFKQYRRLEGVLSLPEQAVVKTATAKLVEGGAVRATQSIKL